MIYLVSRNGAAGYDEYSDFVVRAKSRKEALKIVADELGELRAFEFGFSSSKKPTVKAIKPMGKSAVILGSFHAG